MQTPLLLQQHGNQVITDNLEQIKGWTMRQLRIVQGEAKCYISPYDHSLSAMFHMALAKVKL